WSAPEAMRTTAFWAIVVSFLLALGGQMTFLVHQVSFLSQYLGVSGAASAVSITAGASIIGRLSLGVFVDRLDKRRVAIACFIMQGVAVLAMAYSSHVAVLYLGTMIFGLTMGNLIMMQSLLVGECFGMVSFGTVSGAGGLFTMAGAAMGPMIAGVIFDATQSYRVAFTIFAVASVLAAVTVRYARPPQTSPSPATSVVGPGPI
ncbi:MAG: MFS transporter, partial [Proteobacteria bacterium]|nr:MFS transporter [Pseudomonadota bacterium]